MFLNPSRAMVAGACADLPSYPPPVLWLETLEKVPLWASWSTYLLVWLVLSLIVRNLLARWLGGVAKVQRTEVTEVLAASLPRPAAVGVFLLGLAEGARFLPATDAHTESLRRLLTAAFALLGAIVLVRVAIRLIDAYGRSNPDLRSSAGVGKALVVVLGISVSALLVSDALGISLAPALTALGVGSLAVALALQDTLSNFFSGLYLVVDKPIRPGEFVRVDPSYEGFVEAIGWRSTHLRTLANNRVIIPNGTLSKAIITNFSQPSAQVQASVRIDVGLDADVDRVEDALKDEVSRAVGDVPGMAAEPPPSVSLNPGFAEGLVGFTVFFYAQTFAQQYGAQHALRKRIALRLKKEGVPLPVPALLKAVSGGKTGG
jgi:small-conductance mechanosensitive channel